MNEFAYDIVGNLKHNNEGELIVILFEYCNLACQFCSQDHNSFEGIDIIKEKIKPISKVLDILKQRKNASVSVNIMGGEVLADEILDEKFKDYAMLIDSIKQYASSINIDINLHIATNMIWKKTDRVKNLIDSTGVKLAASYDPAGRFNVENLKLFVENCKLFKNEISQIGIVITKPNIECFMKNKISQFDFLYKNFTIVFDHYTHSSKNNLNFLLPSDTMLRDFYKHMIDNYPKCHPFLETFDSELAAMYCMRTMYVFPDGSFGSCGSYEGFTKKTNTADISVKIIPILEKQVENTWYSNYNCIECEHMQRCSFGCFLNNHFYIGQRTQEACWLKEVYDYVDNKK